MSLILPPGDWAIEQLGNPAAEPLTLAQAKAQVRIPSDVTDYDELISDSVSAARSFLEETYGVPMVKQQVRVSYVGFPRMDRIRLPVWPVQSVDAMDYVTADGLPHTLNVGEVDTIPVPDVIARLWRKPAELSLPWAHIWPPAVLQSGGAVRISLTVGFLTGESPELLPIPPAALQAMKLLIGHAFFNGSAATIGSLQKSEPLVFGIDALMANIRLYG